MKILVIDDEPQVLQQIQDFLGRKNHQVTTVRSGDDALRAVLDGGFDVVLTDVRMPGMDGVTVMHEIQRLRPGLPVVMMSGHTDVVADEMIAEGASAWVDKPFTDPDKVIQTLLSVTAKGGK